MTDQLTATKPWTARLIDRSELPIEHDDGDYYGASPLTVRIETGPTSVRDFTEEVLGEEMAGGNLLAYLMRRFGYPNHRSSVHVETATYLLSTPLPDLALQISPQPSGPLSLSLGFLVPHETRRAVVGWRLRAMRAWEERRFDWLAAEIRRPAWADEWVEECRAAQQKIVFGEKEITGFRSTLSTLIMGALTGDGMSRSDERRDWLRARVGEYSKIDPAPTPYYRAHDWQSWPDEDPLKAYIPAVLASLKDLLRPVTQGGIEITIHGQADTRRSPDAIGPAAALRSTIGTLANADDRKASELERLVREMGDGDLVQGMQMAIEKLKA